LNHAEYTLAHVMHINNHLEELVWTCGLLTIKNSPRAFQLNGQAG
jgi:hypothetical protein